MRAKKQFSFPYLYSEIETRPRCSHKGGWLHICAILLKTLIHNNFKIEKKIHWVTEIYVSACFDDTSRNLTMNGQTTIRFISAAATPLATIVRYGKHWFCVFKHKIQAYLGVSDFPLVHCISTIVVKFICHWHIKRSWCFCRDIFEPLWLSVLSTQHILPLLFLFYYFSFFLSGQQEDEENAGGGAASEEGAGEDRQESFEEHERPDLGRDQPLRSVCVWS